MTATDASTTSITFVGGGNMATALIGGLLQRGYTAERMQVIEISDTARQHLESKFGVRTHANLTSAPLNCDVLLLAVKPQQLREVAQNLKPALTTQLILSIAAGVRTGDLARWLGNHAAITRAMPNTPALVLSGAAAIYATPGVSSLQRAQAEGILAAVGSVIWVQEEEQLDAVTAVSGSGPAYVFYFIEAMDQAARELGLNGEQARRLVIDTFIGAAKLAAQSEEPAAVLRARVTSKGGTTERAITEFDATHLKQHIIQAVKAAAVRSRELGETFGQAG